MDELINTVNKLQEVFNASGQKSDINLPQVVVVGSQSSGKSSVLEHIVGKSFLPRGTGIVTRCPLILQLRKSKGEEYAVFQHKSTDTFTDSSLICEEIIKQTEILAGGNKGICRTPIILKLFSPSHLDLTLVDLPGLTKVPVGDQPEDIDIQINNLIMEYVQNPNSVILVVIPANVDMATSESLKISRDVDPEGNRTLAIVTKLDLMDEGTDPREMLCGKIIPVKLGIIGVVNRSQKDINEGKSVEDSLEDEAAFFKKKYGGDLALQHGTKNLIKKIQDILIVHIKHCLPELKDTVMHQLANRRSELMVFDRGNLDLTALMLDLLTKFSQNLCSIIKGDLLNIDTVELYGGAKINYVFQNTFHKALADIDPLAGLSNIVISTAILNASGANPALFAPQRAFELLVQRQLKSLRNPCVSCIDQVHNELNQIKSAVLNDPELGLIQYPKLYQKISAIVSEMLKERLPKTKEIVNHFIDVQLTYINTAHPDFTPIKHVRDIKKEESDEEGESSEDLEFGQKFLYSQYNNMSRSGASFSFNNHPDTHKDNKSMSDITLDNTFNNRVIMKNLVKNYFSIVRKLVQDTVPKMIMHLMVSYLMNHIQAQLVCKLYVCDDTLNDILEEAPDVTAKRNHLVNTITTLEHADTILNNLSSTYFRLT